MADKQLARFGRNVRRLREDDGISQEKLAARARCHRNYIGLVERGERNPSLTRIIAIGKALRCSGDSLMAGLLP